MTRDEIEIEVDGRVVKGSYVVERGMITVYGPAGSRSTQLGGSARMPETLARVILRELVDRR